MKTQSDFDNAFRVLTGNPPYPWQRALYSEFLAGRFPPNINLPTGAGKTAIMAVWLAALARSASEQGPATKFPRRLAWIVDRRVVVDQATEEASQLRLRLSEISNQPAEDLRTSLGVLSGDDALPLAISTLRGERADNREWSDDPARPAIIVGTVDMTGSRLLFSGYGDGKYWAAQHAGLLGQDTLIVNDEAHLTPAMAALLARIEELSAGTARPPRTVRISATHATTNCWPKTLAEDEQDHRFAAVHSAEKHLYISLAPAAQLEKRLIDLALEAKPGDRTIVFVEKPEAARRIAAKLQKEVADGDRVLTLTGTMRGYERDRLTEKEPFKDLSARQRANRACWLVATSAGEVGVNISADRLITEASTLDHMLQRFGRANRFGESSATIHVFAPPNDASPAKGTKGEAATRIRAAVGFLETLPAAPGGGRDVSPKALFGRDLPPEACSPVPLLAPLHPWQLDNLSLTTLGPHPARPLVEPWLQGKQDSAPETYIAWRNDVQYLAAPNVDPSDRKAALNQFPLLAHEQLREPTHLLLIKLQALAETAAGRRPVLLRRADGSVEALQLGQLWADPGAARRLEFAQLVLPPGLAGLDGGMLTPETPPNTNQPYDLSSICPPGNHGAGWRPRGACLLATDTNAESPITLSYVSPPAGSTAPSSEPAGTINCLATPNLRSLAFQKGWRLVLRVPIPAPEGTGGQERELIYFASADQARQTFLHYPLTEHLDDTARQARAIATRLGLEPALAHALETAARLHDTGKGAPVWQRAAGNPSPAEAIAKPIKPMRGRDLGGFRHELASLIEALSSTESLGELRDLVLHLIAAHHGHARPSFEARTYDQRDLTASHSAATSATQRFARLSRRYGPWGLAYLESLLRAADALASKQPQPRANGAAQ